MLAPGRRPANHRDRDTNEPLGLFRPLGSPRLPRPRVNRIWLQRDSRHARTAVVVRFQKGKETGNPGNREMVEREIGKKEKSEKECRRWESDPGLAVFAP